MNITHLHLRNFRNIGEESFEFHPQFNILVGSNAHGKTNIIEAIHFLAFGRSFRVTDFRGLIQWNQTEAIVRCQLSTPVGDEERTAQLNSEKKRSFKNGKATTPNQFESMPLVLFAPEEILLLRDSPQARRDYIDGLLCKLIPQYSKILTQYKRALSQRNKLLKNEQLSRTQKLDQMVFWEGPLFDNGAFLIQERLIWMERVNRLVCEHYNTIVGEGRKTAGFAYTPYVGVTDFAGAQAARREEEIDRQVTLVGPHRDDYTGRLNGEPITAFGSQGEQRTLTLALKLSEIRLFEEVLGRQPIFLLDDVASELDEKRNSFFFEFLKKYEGQIFATATSLSLFPKEILGHFGGWKMEEGRAKPFTS